MELKKYLESLRPAGTSVSAWDNKRRNGGEIRRGESL
jgi:hypothetical protein